MTKTVCLLHNIIIDLEGIQTNDLSMIQQVSNNGILVSRATNASSKYAQAVRNTYKNYFNGTGAVSWQNDYVLNS